MLEQKYFDIFHPNLNILTVAGSRLGHTVSAETKAKMALRQPSSQAVIVTATFSDVSIEYVSRELRNLP